MISVAHLPEGTGSRFTSLRACFNAAVLCFCFLANSAAVWAASPSDDLTVKFESHKYKIPYQYFSMQRPQRLDIIKLSTLSLEVLFPNMEPALDHPEELKRLGWNRQMTVLFQSGQRYQFRHPEDMVEFMLNTSKLRKDEYHSKDNECAIYVGDFISTHEFHVCDIDNKVVYFSCFSKEGFIKFPSCKVFENIDSEISVIYTFSKDYVSDIQKNPLFCESFPPLPSNRLIDSCRFCSGAAVSRIYYTAPISRSSSNAAGMCGGQRRVRNSIA